MQGNKSLITRAFCPPETPPETDQPTRSRVAAVGDAAAVKASAAGDSAESIVGLLKGLGSKTASAALTGAVTLEKLPAAQRMALKQALRAATEAHNEVETIKGELTKVKGRLQLAEKDLLEKSQALALHTAEANAQVAGLTEDLAAAVVTGLAFESRSRARAVWLWCALGTALSAAIVCAFLLFRPRPAVPPFAVRNEVPASRVLRRTMPEAVAHKPHAEASAPGKSAPQESTPEESTEAAFDRLDQALAGVPFPEIDRALSEANRWLRASGAPPCSVRFDGTKVSLLVMPAGKADGPLAASLVRCAQAVEHVVAQVVE